MSRRPPSPRVLQLTGERHGVARLFLGLSLEAPHHERHFITRLLLIPSLGLSLMDVDLTSYTLLEHGHLVAERALVRIDRRLRLSPNGTLVRIDSSLCDVLDMSLNRGNNLSRRRRLLLKGKKSSAFGRHLPSRRSTGPRLGLARRTIEHSALTFNQTP